jgi:hypothetical protein
MKIVKWVAGIFVGLAILGAMLPSDKQDTNTVEQVADKDIPTGDDGGAHAKQSRENASDKLDKAMDDLKKAVKPKPEVDKTGVVGQKITNAGTTYRVTNARTTKTLGDQEYGLGEKAAGTFVIVGLELTNNKDETKTFMDNSAKIVTSDGSKYESSTEASLNLKDNLMLEDIQPDLTTKGQIGYDVPESKLAGAKLVIEDLWGNGEVKVDLGL